MPRLNRVPLLKFAGRFTLAIALLLTLNLLYGKTATEALLPTLRWELEQLDDTYRILDLRLDREGRDSVIRLDVGLEKAVVIGGRALMPDPRARANVSTLAGHVTQPALLCLALILAWPAYRAIEYPVRALIAIVGLALVILIDVPFVLWGELWNLHVSALEPDRFSPLLIWRNFLQGGGRFVLGLAVGVLAVIAGQALSARSRQTPRL
ncbi:MAG: hypothetical protein IV108_09205 [Burkholderiales bacterium]|nr:hypothetical protein [Burkholderiales bacterium]